MAKRPIAKDTDPSKPLKNVRHEKFCLKYITYNRNGNKAALDCGYSPKTARIQASTLLTKPNICNRVAFLTEQALSIDHVTMERVILEQARISFADPGRMFDEDGNMLNVQDMPEDIRRAIGGVDIKVGVEVTEETEEDYQTDGKVTNTTTEKVMTTTTSKIKLNPKSPALNDLMRHLGGFEKDNKQRGESMADAAAIFASRLRKEADDG